MVLRCSSSISGRNSVMTQPDIVVAPRSPSKAALRMRRHRERRRDGLRRLTIELHETEVMRSTEGASRRGCAQGPSSREERLLRLPGQDVGFVTRNRGLKVTRNRHARRSGWAVLMCQNHARNCSFLQGAEELCDTMLAITRASAISLRLTSTSGGPRPSSSNAKGSNARPSQIVVCSITCMPLNLNHR